MLGMDRDFKYGSFQAEVRILGHRHPGRHGQARGRLRGEHGEDADHGGRGLPVRSPLPHQQGDS